MSAAIRATDEAAVRGTSSSVLGMVLFVASEAMFFAAFFGAYMTTYAEQKTWPPNGFVVPDLVLPSVAAAILLLSAVALNVAARAARRGAAGAVTNFLAITLVGAIIFAVLTIIGYTQLDFGVHDGIFASMFYVVTGLGLAHVIGGIVLLGLVFAQARSGQLVVARYEPIQASSIYWNFVVLLGILIYIVFYVLISTHG